MTQKNRLWLNAVIVEQQVTRAQRPLERSTLYRSCINLDEFNIMDIGVVGDPAGIGVIVAANYQKHETTF